MPCKRSEINYIFLALLFLSTVALACLRLPTLGFPLSFLLILHILGQATLEIGGLLWVSALLARGVPRWVHDGCLSCSSLLLILHFTDFTMIRILDAPISYLFKFFFGHGLVHILTSFQALNLNLKMVALSSSLLVLVPALGFALYRGTARLCRRKPLSLSLLQSSVPALCGGLALCALHFATQPLLTHQAFASYQKTLPLGALSLSCPAERLSLPAPIAPPRRELLALPWLEAPATPNIYFFVIETLRKDIITAEITPYLSAFAEANLQFDHSFANANSTYLSWFALFQSDLPHHWLAMKETWKRGSLPLQLLKQLGYKIRVYSSANLSYFGLDRVLFGERLELPDGLESYPQDLAPYLRDERGFQDFAKDLATVEGKRGNVFLFFLDSPHSEYNFPPDFPRKFEPIAPRIDYLTLDRDDIEPIKNRYRTSCAYVDSLMGKFFARLQAEGLYEEAIIAITGDHGEEFFEDGALFHGTHLNHTQTSIPILLKCENNPWKLATKSASHIDLFPSLLHYLTKKTLPEGLFDGRSVFLQHPWPYWISMLQNGPGIPRDFVIENDQVKIVAQFLPPGDPEGKNQINILSYDTIPPLTKPIPLKEFLAKYSPDAFDILTGRPLRNSPP